MTLISLSYVIKMITAPIHEFLNQTQIIKLTIAPIHEFLNQTQIVDHAIYSSYIMELIMSHGYIPHMGVISEMIPSTCILKFLNHFFTLNQAGLRNLISTTLALHSCPCDSNKLEQASFINWFDNKSCIRAIIILLHTSKYNGMHLHYSNCYHDNHYRHILRVSSKCTTYMYLWW